MPLATQPTTRFLRIAKNAAQTSETTQVKDKKRRTVDKDDSAISFAQR
jgi:hypothetical protein